MEEKDGLRRFSRLIALQWKSIIASSVVAGLLGYGGASLLKPVYTAHAVVIPPQQQQGAAAGALSSLGALAGLAGLTGGGGKSSIEQYIALLQSVTVSDRIIDRFKLMQVYDEEFRSDARKELLKNVIISAGKKSGLILVDVDDHDPKRAADMANAYVDELRVVTNELAVSEAQQRRKFFEQKLEETKSRLTSAQVALQGSGFDAATLRAEPKAVAEGYAKLRAEVTAAAVRLQTLRNSLADTSPEVRQQQAQLTALRAELAKLEQVESSGHQNQQDAGYIGRYREYKYQETLFELYAKQFEMARLDESREGAIVQVVDAAMMPDKKSKPKKSVYAVGFALLGALLMIFRAALSASRIRSE